MVYKFRAQLRVVMCTFVTWEIVIPPKGASFGCVGASVRVVLEIIMTSLTSVNIWDLNFLVKIWYCSLKLESVSKVLAHVKRAPFTLPPPTPNRKNAQIIW
jgi:hypothetical protein